VDGELGELAMRVCSQNDIRVDDEKLTLKKKFTYIAFNKPTGITTTTDPKDKTNIISFINHSKRIFPIGRLDKDSEGLILLTDDGDIVNKILREANNHEKQYLVVVNKPLTKDFPKLMNSGIIIDGKKTKPCKIKIISKNKFEITLTQGLNRQIRRMCANLGYKVLNLQRTRIMKITLGNLKLGRWRNLSEVEIAELNKTLENSIK
jgi:23S rRNA pseudouridine2604 synthase